MVRLRKKLDVLGGSCDRGKTRQRRRYIMRLPANGFYWMTITENNEGVMMPLIKGAHHFDDQFTQIPNTWVRDARLSLKARGLLVNLMSHRVGWSVSIRTLAKTNNCGLRSIRSAIDELMEFGYIARSDAQGRDDEGNFTDYTYTTQDPPDYDDLARLRFATTRTAHARNATTKKNISKKTISKAKESVEPDGFGAFWLHYPNKVDKARAVKAFRKLTPAKVKLAIAGSESFANDPNLPEKRFIPYPATWLNGERWEDGPLPARTRKGASMSRADENAAILAKLEQGGNGE
jgi:hypothetical protein